MAHNVRIMDILLHIRYSRVSSIEHHPSFESLGPVMRYQERELMKVSNGYADILRNDRTSKQSFCVCIPYISYITIIDSVITKLFIVKLVKHNVIIMSDSLMMNWIFSFLLNFKPNVGFTSNACLIIETSEKCIPE